MAKNPNKLQTALAQVFSYLISYNSFEKKLEEIRKKRQKIYQIFQYLGATIFIASGVAIVILAYLNKIVMYQMEGYTKPLRLLVFNISKYFQNPVIDIVIFAVILGYAVIRYNIIKGVPWTDVPLFISNKAIALGSVVFIALSFIIGPMIKFWPGIFTKFQPLRKYFGLLGFGFASIHALISLLIFTPQYYPKFFLETGKLNCTNCASLAGLILEKNKEKRKTRRYGA